MRGQRFYQRRDVREAIRLVREARLTVRGRPFAHAVLDLWALELGYSEGVVPSGAEARERTAALDTLLAILEEVIAGDAAAGADAFLTDVASRDKAEEHGSAMGVNLLTYHRAKGMEWDAVFLPMLEEGSLPIHHAAEDPAALGEERRLFYVGITRARVHLALSWAERRTGITGREGRRRSSRFLDDLLPPRGTRIIQLPDAVPSAAHGRPADSPLMVALRGWRTARAKADGVAPFIVAHDSMLLAIADSRPSTIAELRRVKGMGPTKLERYGDEILGAMGHAALSEPS